MNEQQWLNCTVVAPMLEHLDGQSGTSFRKIRLFGAACCHRIWDMLEPDARLAIETLEKYVDGGVSAEQMRAAAAPVEREVMLEFGTCPPSSAVSAVTTFTSTVLDIDWASVAVLEAVRAEAMRARPVRLRPRPTGDRWAQKQRRKAEQRVGEEKAAQCDLLRDIFHGPCSAVFVKDHWRSEAVVRLATYIYQDRDFDLMPVLADALIDADCADEQILTHCQQPGSHVRGCWVLDLLLKKF